MLDPRHEDAEVRAIRDVFRPYQLLRPGVSVDAYRQNSGSIRIRIIDPNFQQLDRALRHDLIWETLGTLPEDIQSQITVLLLLTPEEATRSFANMDFENPIPSRL